MEKQKIILDMDNALTLPVQDTDDGMALGLALTSPEIDLMGCTTCAGNCSVRQSTENTLRMLEIAKRPDIPVASGRERPFLQNVDAHFQFLEAKTSGPERIYWKRMPPPAKPSISPVRTKAHEFIANQITSSPGEIIIVCLGSFTNLALALLAEPGIAPMIREIVHMGGAIHPEDADLPPFNWQTPDIPDNVWRDTLRFNTMFDPEASMVVFTSGVPLTFVTPNVTTRVFQTLEEIERLATSEIPFHRHLYEAGRPWVEWSIHERKLPGAHMHDPLALAVVIDQSLCAFERMHIDIDGFAAGHQYWLVRNPRFPEARVAVDVSAVRFQKFLSDRLASPVVGQRQN